ncbi:MAG: hypothetical protein EXQ70_08410 [Solirubrobacterales bacterium]|nr:hypothetical protein [Solirubrobacterales bacterium]
MSRALTAALAMIACVTALVAIAGCGSDEGSDVIEGEPVELSGMKFNVQITRFLNPYDVEDEAYLEGRPLPPPGKVYLGVFMEVDNETGSDLKLPSAFELPIDVTTGTVYRPIHSESAYALPLEGTIPADESIPADDTTAKYGPIKGALVLYLLDETDEENRPLVLQIKATGEDGSVEEGSVKLDI